ncbi:putative transporter [Trachipleistophora hominis]|uniref:Putative transporter n=1 Tax=Trachipleistophora hominis TaxID=72359 RepID=L7JYE1_TRAHO|nr:putative transporter [Trachipleistophora hominis]
MLAFLSKLNVSFYKLYIAIIPILSSLLTMFIHSRSTTMKINMPLSLGIIIISTINMLFQKSSTTIRDCSEIITLGCGLGILAQFLLNVSLNMQYKVLVDVILKMFERKIIYNLLPILFSAFTDLGIISFLNREHAVIFKGICSVLTMVLMTVVLKQLGLPLYYDWRIVLPLLIIPSFFLMVFLPSKQTSETGKDNNKYRRACIRTSCFITSITITITCFLYLLYYLQTHNSVINNGAHVLNFVSNAGSVVSTCWNKIKHGATQTMSFIQSLPNKAKNWCQSFYNMLRSISL